MATSGSSKSNKYWDSQLYALEYELRSVSTSFPLTNARREQLTDAVIKADSAVGHGFAQMIKGKESELELNKWQHIITFMKKSPQSISPIWNSLLNCVGGLSDSNMGSETILSVRDKLEKAYADHNKREIERLGKSNITEDVGRMIEQISHALESKDVSLERVVAELSNFYQLDCNFKRSCEQFEKAIDSMQAENKRRDERHDRQLKEMKQQLKNQTQMEEKYNKVIQKLQAQPTPNPTSNNDQAQEKVLQSMVKDLKKEIQGLRSDRSEEISRNVHEEISKVSDQLDHMKLNNQQLNAQNEQLLKDTAERNT